MLEARKFQVIEIARIFGLHPSLLYALEHSSYNTLEAAQQTLLQDSLMPYISRIEDELNDKLFPNGDFVVKFDTESAVKGSLQAQSEYYSKLFNIGAMTLNEIRERLNLDRIEGCDGDHHFVPVNLQTLDNAAHPKINDNGNNATTD